ncbi:MAG: hypothetical protein ACI89X_002588 [Planctomycetota bacterium]|jgi:hypothetical protein
MNKLTTTLLAAAALSSSAFAHFPSYLTTYSQVENTAPGSGGTVLGTLRPNEVAHVDFSVPCALMSAEKWTPRTCSHVMAGDVNADGVYFQGNIFGSIDALVSTSTWTAPVPHDNQRTLYMSPSVAMGTNISAPGALRPGDVGRIVRLPTDGQIEYFLTQEQVNLALGLAPVSRPLATSNR